MSDKPPNILRYKMRLYTRLSKIPFLRKSYALKFLFIAFLGIHIPLIGIVVYILFGPKDISVITVFSVTLILTLLATGATLWILKKLVTPIEIASKSLLDYSEKGVIPSLPTKYTDEVGLLLSNLQMRINENEDLLNEKKDLIYLLSHDLRNFATTPQFLSKFILEEEPSEKVRGYAELILESTTHQFEFLESFILLLKEEELISRSTLELHEYELDEILQLVGKVLNQKLDNKRIHLIINNETDAVALLIKEEYLQRVLINLVDNAIKFSYPDSEIYLTVMEENDSVVFVIVDNGMGFEPAKKDELFHKFTKQARVGTQKESSTGIGLYLCKKIIERNGGTIYAESLGIDKGSRFTLILKKRSQHV